ncbi:MAG: hypothetical protein NC131_03875 [Roseburia sp.]|nr:hypothetical protein [Roseburia sp.]
MLENEDAVVENGVTDVIVKEDVVAEEPNPAPEKKQKESFGARVKEWFRKQGVALKRKPQKIAFFFFIVSTVLYLIGLNVLSPGPVKNYPSQPYLGLSVFVTTLFSILVLVLFMNTFPKRGIKYKKDGKKHSMNYIMLALTFVFVLVMLLMDILYYKQLTACIAGHEADFFKDASQAKMYTKYFAEGVTVDSIAYSADNYKKHLVSALQVDIAHMVFLGISSLLLATLPLYKKLIMKINTSKVVESTEIKEVIDTED